MSKGLHILTEGDDDGTPMPDNVISLFRPAAAEPVMIGDEFAYIVMDLAVRMRGQFDLPRILVSSAGGDTLS